LQITQKNWFRKVKSNIISFHLVKKSHTVLKSFAGIFCPINTSIL
jgi:hypothetical protein